MGSFQTIKAIWKGEFPTGAPRSHSLIEKLFCSVTVALTLISLSQLKYSSRGNISIASWMSTFLFGLRW